MASTINRWLMGACVLVLASSGPAQSDVPDPRAYNHTYGIATHNSYWLNRSDQVDYFASGTQELISDQLLHEHVRALEIDVHSEGAPAHEWKVYHTSDSEDYSCRFLSECMELLRNFHYAVPQHEVINVVIELKNVVPFTGALAFGIHTNFNFASDHTQEDFDAIFRNTLGSALFTPKDFLDRCDPGKTMLECARDKGWPTVDQLRGKFIINILGNWSTAAFDWAQYSAQNMHEKVAFPMQSVFRLFAQACNDVCGGGGCNADERFNVPFGGNTICVTDIDTSVDPSPDMDQSLRQSAFNNSIFWQLEDLFEQSALDAAAQFLGGGGVIRGHDSFEFKPDCINDSANPDPLERECQEQRIRAGFQLIQTDYPWHFVDNNGFASLGIPTDPSQRLKDPASLPDDNGQVGAFTVFSEPGSRIYFQTGPEYPGTWAFATVPATADRWLEATLSSTRHGDTWGTSTHNGLILDDVFTNCPGVTSPEDHCTNYPRVAEEDGEACIKVMSDSEQTGLEICRQKNTTSGASFFQESVDLFIRVFRDGQVIRTQELVAPRYGPCKHPNDPNSSEVSDICVGSLVALAIRNSGQSSQVSIYSAGRLTPASAIPWLPDWQLLGTGSFAEPISKQGYRGWKSELVVGPRVADQLNSVGINDFRPEFTRLHQITIADLPNREAAGPGSQVVGLAFRAGPVAPSSSVSLSPPPDAFGWNNSDVTVTITAPATLVLGGAAVHAIDYSLSGAQVMADTESTQNPTTFQVTAQGATNATFFAIDGDALAEKPRSVTVRIDKTPPVITATLSPPPNGFGWNRTPVTVSFDCRDALSGVASCTGPTTITMEGAGQTIRGTAVDQALNSASTTATVNLDMTPPQVAYSGNLGSYTVDQSVSISCSATDNLSGVASNGCVPIVGPAYSFNVGDNTVSFTATDFAGNSATATTSFKVVVTFASLCALTQQFSSSAHIAEVLCKKLSGAEAAPNAQAKAGKLIAFSNQVRAEAHKTLTAMEAAILERLVQYL